MKDISIVLTNSCLKIELNPLWELYDEAANLIGFHPCDRQHVGFRTDDYHQVNYSHYFAFNSMQSFPQ